MFHLAVVVLDPYTYESSWILDTAARILEEYGEADCRVAWVLTANEKDTERFLGPWADRMLTFYDEDRSFVKALELDSLPAFVHIGNDLSVLGAAQGWDPEEWREVSDRLATMMSWSRPTIPKPGDPLPFAGSAALG